MEAIELFNKLKNKWILEEIVKFEEVGNPGMIEIHYGLGGNATTIKPKPEIRRKKD